VVAFSVSRSTLAARRTLAVDGMAAARASQSEAEAVGFGSSYNAARQNAVRRQTMTPHDD
jgi:hypothetical protein